MHIENQPHTQQVTNPEKSIAQGDIIDELQTSCLSAGNMDLIRESSYHAGFSKKDLAPREEQRCLNTCAALKTNIDGPLLGRWLQWVRAWCQKVLGCGNPLTVLIDQNKSSIYFLDLKIEGEICRRVEGQSDGENTGLHKGAFSELASVTLDTGLGPSFPISYSVERFSGPLTIY